MNIKKIVPQMLFLIILSIVFLLLINSNCYLFDSDNTSFDLLKFTFQDDTTEIVFDSLIAKGVTGSPDNGYYYIWLTTKNNKYTFKMNIQDTVVNYIVIPSVTAVQGANELYFTENENNITYYVSDWDPLSKAYIFIDEFPDPETHTGFLSGTFTGTFQMENSDSVIEIDNGYFQMIF